MQDARLSDLRGWADDHANGGAPPELAELARIVRAAADGGGLDERALADIGRRAERLARKAETAAARAAARGLLAAVRAEIRRGGAAGGGGARRPQGRLPARATPRAPRLSRTAVVAVAVALVAAGGIEGARIALAPSLSASGPRGNRPLGAADLADLAFVVHAAPNTLARQRWTLDGHDVTKLVRPADGELVFRPHDLATGSHTLTVTLGGGFLGSRRRRSFRFSVDLRPPTITAPATARVRARHALRLRGTLDEDARLTVDGRAVPVSDRRFDTTVPSPLPRLVTLAAVDEAGNRSIRRVRVSVAPRRPSEPVRAVHVTAYGWADATLRRGVLDLIDQHRINAVEIDLKDEGGLVGFGPAIPLARRIGASQKIYDLAAVIRLLHARGIRVIGRIVCFRDPLLAAGAWKAGNRSEVIQTPGGRPYSGYGGFTNFANGQVRRYQIAIAVAAAQAGIDDVLYDYVRRPDGPRSSMVFPGLRGSPEHAIVGFLRETRQALRPYGTYLGASVFGVAATRPQEVAQDIPAMTREVDYISPMVYPSHWAPGEYGVPDPNGQPYEIVKRSLADFAADVRGSGARIVPWLQDFSLGRSYGAAEVKAQIDAARSDGISEFLLWDPAVTYTADALSTDAPISTRGLARPRHQAPVKRSSTNATRRVVALKPVEGRLPNELGSIPVIMHHEIRPDRVGPYDQTPAEFRHELTQLWRGGYWPVTAAEYATGELGSVPAGKTPVVLTFDDSTQFQLSYDARGRIKPTTAIGVMLAFAKSHPGFEPAGTFYVLREPFAGVPQGPAMLRWLVAHGFELGDHTLDHTPLDTLDAAGVQRELVQGERVITAAVPGYEVQTMALPLGAQPKRRSLALRGRWGGGSYRFRAVFLDGAEPAPSPFAKAFDPSAVPRIRSSHLPWSGKADFTWNFWFAELRRNPGRRYVSDGDSAHVTVPKSEADRLAPRFRSKLRTY